MMRTPIGLLLVGLIACANGADAAGLVPASRSGVTPTTLPLDAPPGGGDDWSERPKDIGVGRPHNAIAPADGQFGFEPAGDDRRLLRVLVQTRPFNWSVVYPGPDGQLGR